MSDAIWFYVKDGQQAGPVTVQTLKHLAAAGAVAPDTLVWREGLPEWLPARQCAELGQSLATGVARHAPPITPGKIQAPPPGDATGGLIPYRNGPALAGYYTSVASLIPIFAIVLGPAAIALGVAGWRKAAREPGVGGKAHAIVAIVLGSLTLLGHILVFVLIAINA